MDSGTARYNVELRKTLQRELDALPDGGYKLLPTGEYPGPLVINRAITLEGQATTKGNRPKTSIWAIQGPVLIIQSSQVVLRNLNIEVTGLPLQLDTAPRQDAPVDTGRSSAILVWPRRNPTCQNLEIEGEVIGIPDEYGIWHYPRTLHFSNPLGWSQPERPAEVITLVVPIACQIVSTRTELQVNPNRLNPGSNQVQLSLQPPTGGGSTGGSIEGFRQSGRQTDPPMGPLVGPPVGLEASLLLQTRSFTRRIDLIFNSLD